MRTKYRKNEKAMIILTGALRKNKTVTAIDILLEQIFHIYWSTVNRSADFY